jgi:hypothetical protein
MGYSRVLPMWGDWSEFYFLDHKPIWLSDKYYHYYNTQVHEHCGLVSCEWEPIIGKTMGKCIYGFCWIVFANSSQMEEKEGIKKGFKQVGFPVVNFASLLWAQ